MTITNSPVSGRRIVRTGDMPEFVSICELPTPSIAERISLTRRRLMFLLATTALIPFIGLDRVRKLRAADDEATFLFLGANGPSNGVAATYDEPDEPVSGVPHPGRLLCWNGGITPLHSDASESGK